MKKIISVFLIILLCFTGCGKSGSDDTKDNSSDLKYTVNGVEVVPGTDFSEALKALGDPDNYSEAASCYFDGMDKSYTYSGFEIRTYPGDGGKDYVQDICVTSDKYKTTEGITVGSTLKDVTDTYGDGFELTGSMYKYKKGDKGYTYFFIINDAVKYFGNAVDASN